MISQDSLHADTAPLAERTFCTAGLGWSHVLLRGYRDPRTVDSYVTTPTCDQKLVLVTAGSYVIEARGFKEWRRAAYRPGHIGLVAPGEAAHLRWHGTDEHHNLQLHIPGVALASVAEELFGPRHRCEPLRSLDLIDPVVAGIVLAVERAARNGAPEIYAETAGHFLISHLLLRFERAAPRHDWHSDTARGRRLEDYMHANVSRVVSLGELADLVGIGRFQLLRLTHRLWGVTPQRHLTRIRMDHAKRLILSRRLSITEVALECGYSNPTHFATAFRRSTGLSPSEFQRQC